MTVQKAELISYKILYLPKMAFEIFYCLMCAICLTAPIMATVWLASEIKTFFTEPQDEKPSQEILDAEDDVLKAGGAFAEFAGFGFLLGRGRSRAGLFKTD